MQRALTPLTKHHTVIFCVTCLHLPERDGQTVAYDCSGIVIHAEHMVDTRVRGQFLGVPNIIFVWPSKVSQVRDRTDRPGRRSPSQFVVGCRDAGSYRPLSSADRS